MSIADNIAFGLKIKNKSKAYIDDKIKYALKLEMCIRDSIWPHII